MVSKDEDSDDRCILRRRSWSYSFVPRARRMICRLSIRDSRVETHLWAEQPMRIR